MTFIPRRLLVLTDRFPPDLGGVARSAYRTAKSLADLGHVVHVLAWSRTLPAGQLETTVLQEHSLFAHRVGLYAQWDMTLQHSTNILNWLHRQVSFELVWGHYLFPAGFMAVMCGASIGVPTIVSARGNDIDRLVYPPGDFARLLWTLQRATVVTAVSQDLMRKISVLLGTSERLVALPNVVDSNLFAPTLTDAEILQQRAQLSLPEDALILGFSGELRQKKGLPFLLQALVDVHRHRPARLLVIGEVRPKEQSALAQFEAEHPGTLELIRVTGHTDDPQQVATWLQCCDVVVTPSLWDGMPNSVLEAMSCQCLVIASDAGGIPEIIRHGVDGCLIETAQLHRLGEGILELLTLPSEKQQAIRQQARQRVIDAFHPTQEACRLSQLIEQLIAPALPSPLPSSDNEYKAAP